MVRLSSIQCRLPRSRWLMGWAVIAAGMLGSGCGPSATSLSGRVTLDGIPLEKAIVEFSPEDKNDRPAVVLTDSYGRYRVSLSAVPFRVVIQCQKVVGQMENEFDPEGPPIDRYDDIIPRRYMNRDTTPLEVQPIFGRTTVADFQLTSRE